MSDVVNGHVRDAPHAATRGRRGRLLVAVLLATGVLLGMPPVFRTATTVRLNVSPSVPVGVYRLDANSRPAHGLLMLVCLPESLGTFGRMRGYLLRGDCPGHAAPVGKRVLALSGDTVQVTARGLVLNGVVVAQSRPLRVDGHRRLLTILAIGSYIVGPGEVWVFAPDSPRSWDSRYFGAVPASGLQGRLLPIWTITAYRRQGV